MCISISVMFSFWGRTMSPQRASDVTVPRLSLPLSPSRPLSLHLPPPLVASLAPLSASGPFAGGGGGGISSSRTEGEVEAEIFSFHLLLLLLRHQSHAMEEAWLLLL